MLRRLAILGIALVFFTPAAPRAESLDPSAADAYAEEDEFDALFELDEADEAESRDPFENENRKFFAFNETLDAYFFRPVVRGYRMVVPELARAGVRRFFHNLESPVFIANDLLQLRFVDAAETLGAFTLNAAFGLGGVFDVATEAGIAIKEADFGQTLARAGVGSGPYLVFPLLGPSTVRDGFGDLVDQLFNPLTYILGPTQRVFVGGVLSGSSGIATMESKSQQIDALRESSVDFYAAMRSAYLQSRAAEIWQD